MKTIEEIDISRYDLIILDCDGTLVDSEPISNGTVADMIRELGIPITNKEAFNKFVGTSFGFITEYVENLLGKRLEFDFEAKFRVRVLEKFEAELKAIPGVPDFLDKLSIPFCVASNGPKEKMLETLRITKMLRHFQNGNMFSAYDIQKWKPEPDLFLLASKEMKVPANNCLVIEDTMHGVMGAINAKMDVLYYIPEGQLHPPSKIDIRTFSQFEKLVM